MSFVANISSKSEENNSDKEVKTGRLVLVRHGQSELNAKNVSTGWIDSALTVMGINQAKKVGNQLKYFGFKPDVVFSSKLSRAVDTAKNILNKLGRPNQKIIQLDDLIERHYGGMTGKNKQESENEYGDMFKKYRRGYAVLPPVMDKDHPYHPDNENSKIPKEQRAIGMPKNGKGAESLEDVVERVKPIWEDELLPRLQNGDKILIAAHGNSLRALSKIIQNMTPEQVEGYEMENGKPVVYDIKSKINSNQWTFKEIGLSGLARAA